RRSPEPEYSSCPSMLVNYIASRKDIKNGYRKMRQNMLDFRLSAMDILQGTWLDSKTVTCSSSARWSSLRCTASASPGASTRSLAAPSWSNPGRCSPRSAVCSSRDAPQSLFRLLLQPRRPVHRHRDAQRRLGAAGVTRDGIGGRGGGEL